ETNLAADAPSATSLGDRGAWVGLAGDAWGEVRLGREYNNAFWNPIVFSPWGTSGVGQTLFHAARGAAFSAAGYRTGVPAGKSQPSDPYIRNNNSISYILPGNLGGVYGSFQYALDEQAAAGNNLGQNTNFRIGYKDGALDVALGYGEVDGLAAVNDVKSLNIGASYDFGVVKVMAVWNEDKLKNATTGAGVSKLTGYEIGASLPLGPGRLRASYGSIKFDNLTPAADPKASKYAVGYVYPMSKRTSVYASYARVSNKNGLAMTTIGATGAVASRSASGMDFGISHTF
ncbi:MAG: porin, partial [Gammaproteobacteria bacterium]